MNLKKKIALFLAMILCSGTVFAHTPITVYVDGTQVVFPDQSPVIVSDRTLVPMRKIFEAMGANVTWSEPTQTITSVRNGDTVQLKIGDSNLYKNGVVIDTMDVPAQIMQDRTMVPVRAIAQAFGAKVDWNGTTYVINITTQSNTVQSSTENSYHEEIYAEDGTLLLTVDYRYTPLHSQTDVAKRINDTVRSELAEKAATITAQYTAIAQTLYQGAKNEGMTYFPCYCMGTYAVSGETSEFASVTLEERTFTGGSEELSFSAQTYSMETGTPISLTDIVPDNKEEIESIAKSGFLTLIAQNPSGFYTDATKRVEQYFDQIDFYLAEDKIVFYINAGILAETYAGVIAFSIPYEM